MAICEYLRDLERRYRHASLVGCLIACCIRCILHYIEFLTRFALCIHALSGEDFCSSARKFTDHLQKHGFTAVSVDALSRVTLRSRPHPHPGSIPSPTPTLQPHPSSRGPDPNLNPQTLRFGAFVLSVALAGATMGLFYANMKGKLESGDGILFPLMFVLFFASFLFAWVILSFIAAILLNVIDASYACLILDLDNAAQTRVFQRPEIAQAILVKVKPGYVVGTVSSEGGAGAPPVVVVADGHGQPPTGQPVAMPIARPVDQPVVVTGVVLVQP